MENCLFCKIISGETESFKIWEDAEYIAILDVFPNVKGQTLVLPKKHFESYPFDIPENNYVSSLLAAKKVAKLLEQKLHVKRVALVVEGMGINHLHIKLYPLHGLTEKFTETWTKEKIYFQQYEGYISTQLGPPETAENLQKLAKKFRSNFFN